MRKLAKLEYVWIDGYDDNNIRSKTRYIPIEFGDEEKPISFEDVMKQIPQWSFDGSSTNQSEPLNSDLILKPVRFFGNPFSNNQRDNVSYIVLCEVFNTDDTPHESNNRAKLRDFVNELEDQNDLWFGVEQEYLLVDSLTNYPDGWDCGDSVEPQGKYYCGVGGKHITNTHRRIIETHAQFCIQSGINLNGTNAEVMKSQWEYQLGPAPAISCADQLWVSRYILNRLAEAHEKYISYDPKPVEGDWNGSGCHINISNKKMREEGGKEYVTEICEMLKESHSEHVEYYGSGNERRLTGEHETSDVAEFTYGESDRGASVRIPHSTINNEYKGHIEDRRPSANIDPYKAFLYISGCVTPSTKEEELVIV